mgnify:CR=1 FL=1
MTSSVPGNPTQPSRDTGTRRTQMAVASAVSTNTATTAASEAVTTARSRASASINSTTGQSRKEGADNLNIGNSTSNNASDGNKCIHHTGGSPGRRRWTTTGKTE